QRKWHEHNRGGNRKRDHHSNCRNEKVSTSIPFAHEIPDETSKRCCSNPSGNKHAAKHDTAARRQSAMLQITRNPKCQTTQSKRQRRHRQRIPDVRFDSSQTDIVVECWALAFYRLQLIAWIPLQKTGQP